MTIVHYEFHQNTHDKRILFGQGFSHDSQGREIVRLIWREEASKLAVFYFGVYKGECLFAVTILKGFC